MDLNEFEFTLSDFTLNDYLTVFIFAVSLTIWDILFIGNLPLSLPILFLFDSTIGFWWLSLVKTLINVTYRT